MKATTLKHAHVCVWIDHREAKLFGIGLDGVDEAHLGETGPHHHIRRKADPSDKGAAPLDTETLNAVADVLVGVRGILIVGPGQARTELAAYLDKHRPAIAGCVWGVEAMDHPTDGQIVAAARKFFLHAEPLHA